MSFHSDYLQNAFNHKYHVVAVKSVCKILKLLKKDGLEFDSIAFSGNSGASIAYPVSYFTGLPLICVRKKNESSHGKQVEFSSVCKNYLIIDDVIASGHTIRYIKNSIKKYFYTFYIFDHFNKEYHASEIPKCCGIILHNTIAYDDYYNIPVYSFRGNRYNSRLQLLLNKHEKRED